MKKDFYDVQDIINAGFNLEPLKCRHCGKVGETTFNIQLNDAYCELCGKWQISIPDDQYIYPVTMKEHEGEQLMQTTNNLCNKCGTLFHGKDDGQLPVCPNCSSRDSRQTTALEDHEKRRDSIFEKVIEKMRVAHLRWPSLRFCQIIGNASVGDNYYLSDDDLLIALEYVENI